MKRMLEIGCSAALATLCLVSPVRADDADVIDYRQHIMEALNSEASIMGQIAAGLAPKDDVLKHMDVIALLASTAIKSFEPKVAGGGAKPEVWSEWADFSKRMNEFAQNTAKAAKLGHEQGAEGALTHMLEAMTCKGCHDTYREEEK